MSSNILHAPRTIGFGGRRLIYIAIGLVAVALVVVALASSGGPSTTSSPVIGRTVPPTLPDEAGTAGAIGRTSDDAVPPGSGIPFGRGRVPVPEPNLLPK